MRKLGKQLCKKKTVQNLWKEKIGEKIVKKFVKKLCEKLCKKCSNYAKIHKVLLYERKCKMPELKETLARKKRLATSIFCQIDAFFTDLVANKV